MLNRPHPWTVDGVVAKSWSMNNVEKHEAVREHLVRHPEQADRQIAGLLGVSPTFVGKVRRYLEEKGRLTKVETRQGQDGRKRKRRRSRKEIEREELRSKLYWIELNLTRQTKRHEYEKLEGYPDPAPYPHELEAELNRILKELDALGE